MKVPLYVYTLGGSIGRKGHAYVASPAHGYGILTKLGQRLENS